MVSIKKIADTLDFLVDGWIYYLNKQSGEIVEIQREYMGIAEEAETDEDFRGYEDWEQESIKDALLVLDNWSDFIELPDKEEVNEYSIMESFCYSLDNDKLGNKLCSAINGRGAFRRFKEAISSDGIEDQWIAYKHKALCGIAQEWCEFHNIRYED